MNRIGSKTYGKKLSEMSLKELWHLFPIILTGHKSYWKDWYNEEAETLKKILPADMVLRISHIGSTAIEGIWAKPIIDILVEITEHSDFRSLKDYLATAGYQCMSESNRRMSFNKGYTEHGFAERVFHLHLRRFGDNDELYFRDYLNVHPDIAGRYEKLKIGLWKQYEHDRDGYTEAKTEFIREFTCKAKIEFKSERRFFIMENGISTENNFDITKIKEDTRKITEELLQTARPEEGDILVVGCSTSEVANHQIGSFSSADIGTAIFGELYQIAKEHHIFLAVQCCEHLNRALIVEKDCARAYGLEIVNVMPQLKAGGSLATAAYAGFEHAVAVETIQAHAGIDIGDTLIGMHLKAVAVPVRTEQNRIGNAHVVCARTRAKYIGGERAVYL